MVPCRQGLKAEAVEVVYRVHLSLGYQTRAQQHAAALLTNTQRLQMLAPTNVFSARILAPQPSIEMTTKYKVGCLLPEFWRSQTGI